ncbi:MAG: hypothetical protein ACR5K9_03105 [Wolbachia sp.]
MIPLTYILVLGAAAATAMSASRVMAGLSSKNRGMADSSTKAMSGFSNAPLVEGGQDSKKKELSKELAECMGRLQATHQVVCRNTGNGGDKEKLLKFSKHREMLMNRTKRLTNELNQLSKANPVAPSTEFSLLNRVAQFLPNLIAGSVK